MANLQVGSEVGFPVDRDRTGIFGIVKIVPDKKKPKMVRLTLEFLRGWASGEKGSIRELPIAIPQHFTVDDVAHGFFGSVPLGDPRWFAL